MGRKLYGTLTKDVSKFVNKISQLKLHMYIFIALC